MKYHLISCNGYRVVKTLILDSPKTLPALCRATEDFYNDGYAIFASQNGTRVADTEGLIKRDERPSETAGYSHACGYID